MTPMRMAASSASFDGALCVLAHSDVPLPQEGLRLKRMLARNASGNMNQVVKGKKLLRDRVSGSAGAGATIRLSDPLNAFTTKTDVNNIYSYIASFDKVFCSERRHRCADAMSRPRREGESREHPDAGIERFGDRAVEHSSALKSTVRQPRSRERRAPSFELRTGPFTQEGLAWCIVKPDPAAGRLVGLSRD